MSPLVYVVLSAFFFACGEYASKLYANDSTPGNFMLLFLMYNVGVAFWVPAIVVVNKLAVVGSIWSVLSLLATVLIGVVAFQETLHSFQWVGVVLAVLSVLLLSH